MSDFPDWFEDILAPKSEAEDLCDELEQSIVRGGGKLILQHRFFEPQDYNSENNAWYNAELIARRSHAEQLRADRQWWEYVCAHPKESYPAVLEEIKGLAPTAEWCSAVRQAWYDSDVLMINQAAWQRIFSDRAAIAGISTEAERLRFAGEPDPVAVFRGCLPQYADGMSWSLSLAAAEYFKQESGGRGVIIRGVVKKENVIAYICPNEEEFEVIVLPEHVTNKVIVG